jgi:molecular chaperone DnaK
VLSGGGRTLPIALTREQFEEITHDLLERTQVIMEAVLDDAQLSWRDISKVLLVGGLTRMKAVPALIERVSGRKPSHELHPDEVVALGAAIQAGKLALELPEFRPKKQDSRLPGDRNPPVPAPTMVGGISLIEIKLTDVTAHSMGVIALDRESQKEENVIVLERNTPVPCFFSREFFTLSDNQESLILRISQGEEIDLNYVDIIGEADIQLPFRRPALTPFSVKFSYDIDGLLHVTLTDPQTGQSFGEVKIERKANMTQREVNEKRARLNGMVVG